MKRSNTGLRITQNIKPTANDNSASSNDESAKETDELRRKLDQSNEKWIVSIKP